LPKLLCLKAVKTLQTVHDKARIPTAAYKTFNAGNLEDGYAFIRTLKPPYVLKADGLAAGKGVVICPDEASAVQEFTAMVRDFKFGRHQPKWWLRNFFQVLNVQLL